MPQGLSKNLSPQERLRQILLAEKQDLWVIIIYGAFAGLLSLVVPVAVQALVNTIGFGSLIQPIFVLTFLVFIILGFAGLMRVLQSVVMEIVQQRIFARIAMDLAYRLPKVKIEAYDSNHGSELVNRFFDVLIVQKSAAIILLDGIAIILQTALGMVLLAFYHPYLLAFDVLLVSSIFFVVYVLGQKAIVTSIDESKSKYAVAAWLQELARNPLAFKSHGGPQFALLQADELTSQYVLYRKKHFSILLRQIIGSVGLQVGASSVLLGLGGWLVVHKQLTLGQLVASELIVNTVVTGFAKFGKFLETFYDLVASADKLGHLLDLPLERETSAIPSLPIQKGPLSVRLREISFKHMSGVKSLSGLNLDVQAGSTVALIGDNGSGKSTLVSLIFGLRKPETGSVEINGMDLREVPLEQIRSQIAFVEGVEIFSGSVLENIRMNRSDISLQEVRNVLGSLGILEEIMALPDGLLTPLSGSQFPFSAGQVQRLMLARALVGKPRLLILDESLDNIDAESHSKVIEVLFQKNAPWTLILTTHNTDLLHRFDRVYFLTDGKLQERKV